MGVAMGVVQSHRVQALVVLLATLVVVSSCQWSMYGGDPGRTGWNRAESTISTANVGQLQARWSTSSKGRMVVAGGRVYVAAVLPGNVTPPETSVSVFDAAGQDGCSGTPTVCAPLWTYAAPVEARLHGLAVVDGTLYASGGAHFYAFDATGVNSCSGSPKVCQPLWSGDGYWREAAIDDGKVWAFQAMGGNIDVVPYDAKGVTNCAGSPKVCGGLWRGVLNCTLDGNLCSQTDDRLLVANGRVYRGVVFSTTDLRTFPALAWFDEAGIVGCTGYIKICSGTYVPNFSAGSGDFLVGTSIGGGEFGVPPPSVTAFVADGAGTSLWSQVVEVASSFGDVQTGKATLTDDVVYLPVWSGIRAYALHQDPNCAPTPCEPLWRTATSTSLLTVANGVVYDEQGRAYDAAGTVGCSGSPKVCAPIAAIGPTVTSVGSDGFSPAETVVVNGWVYRSLPTGLTAYHL
jgi:hypothetical protein